MLPAMAEPTKFLLMFSSTRAAVLLFSTCRQQQPFQHRVADTNAAALSFDFYLSDHLGRNSGLTNGGLPAAQDPVDGCGLLVGAVVAADRLHLHVRVVLLERVQRLLRALRDHREYTHLRLNSGRQLELGVHARTFEIMFIPMASPV